MIDWILLTIEAAIAIITGYILWRLQHVQEKRERGEEEREESLKKRDLLSLEMQMASAKLSYAVAMAVKRGTPNGEIEDGIKSYEEAKTKYMAFLNELATEHINHH